MRILFLSDNFPPEVNAPATRTYEHCREWVKAGAVVTVITCAPNFPKGKVFEGYQNKLYQVEEVEGIRVIRVWSYIAANEGFLKRIIDFVSYAVMAFWVGLFKKTDLIIGTSPQFFTAIAARVLAFCKRKPWVMEVRDLWPESIAAVGAMSRDSRVYRMLERIEHHLYRSADVVVPVTDAFKAYIAPIRGEEAGITVIKNGVDATKFQPLPKDEALLQALGLHGKFVVGYLGTHGMAHALDFILEAAKRITAPDVVIILQGDGAEKKKLLAKAEKEQINNVIFLPFVAKSEIRRYISILDVALVNLKKSDTFKSVIPSKIFENACMEKPILLGVEGESKAIIEQYDAGLAYEPENEHAFLSALEQIREPVTYQQKKLGCQALANDFERKNLAGRMLATLTTAVEKKDS